MENALGKKEKEVLEVEKELHDFARRYIYAKEDINKGEEFREDIMIILRPGTAKKGFEPSKLKEIIGKKALKDIKKDEPICEEDVNGE